MLAVDVCTYECELIGISSTEAGKGRVRMERIKEDRFGS